MENKLPIAENKLPINEILLGDSYELIKNIPSKSIDLIITDPPYQFNMGGSGHSEIALRKSKQKDAIYKLDTKLTKKMSGGGCFGTKNRKCYSDIADTDTFNEEEVQKAYDKYITYLSEHGKDEESERLRVIYNAQRNKLNTRFISDGITNEILDECCRVLKKINIYIWCNKNQLRQLIDYFDNKGCNIDLLTRHKTNPIPTCNNTYLSDTEYLVFAREKGVKLGGSFATKRKYYVTEINVKDKELYKHPTIKPLHIIKNLIINSSKENDIILDPFIGSGTTAVAAKELNRNYIGIELNPTFHKIALDRLNGITQIKLQEGQMSLFDF